MIAAARARTGAARPKRSHLLWSIAAGGLAMPGIVLSVARFLPWDIGTPWIQLLSAFPLAILVTLVALLAALIYSGRGKLVLLLGVILLLGVQLAAVVPRLFPAEGALADQRKPKLTVMSLNVGDEEVSVNSLLKEVRSRNVDVLALPELNPETLGYLESAGIADLFPYRVLDVDEVATGSGIFSRFPLENRGRVPGSEFYQSRAVVKVPAQEPAAATDIELTAVHVASPRQGQVPPWRKEIKQLAGLTGSERPAILFGDFNASIDHREFRELLDAGLKDAAQATGRSLWPTWPQSSPLPPFVALDHVLFNDHLQAGQFTTVVVPGTDHAAVVADVHY